MCRSFNCLIKCLLWKWKFPESHEKPSAKLMDTRQQRRGMHAHHDICTFERRNQSTPGHGATTHSILQPRVAARKNNAWQLSSDSCVALIKGDERSVYTHLASALCVYLSNMQWRSGYKQAVGVCVPHLWRATDQPTNTTLSVLKILSWSACTCFILNNNHNNNACVVYVPRLITLIMSIYLPGC